MITVTVPCGNCQRPMQMSPAEAVRRRKNSKYGEIFCGNACVARFTRPIMERERDPMQDWRHLETISESRALRRRRQESA